MNDYAYMMDPAAKVVVFIQGVCCNPNACRLLTRNM